MDLSSDADLQYRLDRRSDHHRRGNIPSASLSNATDSGIGSASVAFASDAHFVNEDEDENADFHLSRTDEKIQNLEQPLSQSFRNAHDSLSPDANHPDEDGADNDQTKGQKKVKAPRLYHKKSRNGCQRCKARRVKVLLDSMDVRGSI